MAKKVDLFKTIPTYVEASHWGKLKIDSISELWDIVDNSIRTFAPSIRFSEDLFNHSLKMGYLCFIFDGFDELCGQRYSQFNPNDVLYKLAKITEESNAKIIITTRTLYWQSEITNPPNNVKTISIAPFNTQQAKGYFEKYFKDDNPSRDRATHLYKELVKSNKPTTPGGSRSQIVNLPLCVGMIAEYVKLGSPGHLTPQSGKGLIRDVLYQICDRERERKNLLTEAENQLAAFEEIAVDQSEKDNPYFELELLAIAGFDENDIDRIVDHPLLNTADGSRYQFSYDFLPQYLKAFYLSNAFIKRPIAIPDNTWRMMTKEANGKSFIIEHLIDLLNDTSLINIKECYRRIPNKFEEAKSFIFHLLQNLLRASGYYITQDERTNGLFDLLSDSFSESKTISNLFVIGTIDNLNLKNMVFNKCNFTNVIFSKCNADQATIFNECKFSGELNFLDCKIDSFKNVDLRNCSLIPPTNLIWEDVRGKATGKREEHIIDAMRLALNKFWHHGRIKRSIRKEYWRRGSLGHSIYCDKLLKEMIKLNIIAEVTISAVSEGGYALLPDVITDIQRFMDNRQLTGKIRELFDILNK